MLAIGRALMTSPKLLCIDEPSTGLAPIMKEEVFKKIAEIRKMGITVLLVEQEVNAVFQMADRNYGAAESHFEKAQILGRGNINLHYYRILALAYAGEQEQAEKLARELRSKRPPTRNDGRFWEFCSKTLGLVIS